MRRSSQLLTATILTVTALHIPSSAKTFDDCYNEFLGLISSSMFSKYHSVDDVRALCIAAFWLSDGASHTPGLDDLLTQMKFLGSCQDMLSGSPLNSTFISLSSKRLKAIESIFSEPGYGTCCMGPAPSFLEINSLIPPQIRLRSPFQHRIWSTAYDKRKSSDSRTRNFLRASSSRCSRFPHFVPSQPLPDLDPCS